ncbi:MULTISPECIES: methylmalonyl-CoA mutase subunit beta [Aequorivita]|uniref:Methylmalonyl-CoA mutase subunit beta n=1 Tax=Aequorivita iocasae TaxID=2803865 RepID=A0ABX7DS07_9FLAO|nr:MULTISPECIES: methylmalonyl-CoA mutase subunit beta [Aequorivita]QQX76600.1 methylmalonyl-CoA mutase subunit beta [Aequorivita iocasae]UCA56071.1 methylmalonyl-CoA mutase subunit beta [Aequorivita sp. F7]
MSKFLFEDFDEVSAKQWKQQIQYDLKGADYNETLVWQSPEGINVKPFYHEDDFKEGFQPVPGQPKTWKIAQEIFIDDEKIANHIALDALKRGAEAIVFTAAEDFDPKTVFKDFPLDQASIYFKLSFLSEAFYGKLIKFFSEKKATVFYNIDLIGNLARTGNWFNNLKKDHEMLDSLFQKYPSEKLLSVDASLYQNAGANIVQQLAYALAHANEYLNHVCHPERLEGLHKQNFKLTFLLTTGPNYFFEIAKIRALRKLYAALAKEYGTTETCHIIATPSKRNKTLYDYNVNLLRSTTECMSAILGGADTVCNLPYDALYHKSNEFGERISRNQLLILKHESYFDTVSNPADGAYYIESLTAALAEKALQLFKEIEKGGGFLQQLKEGTIQKKIKESAEKEQQLFDSGKLKLLGTNYHPNKNDRMKHDLELFPFVKHNPVKTLIPPIVERRLSEITEQERLKLES